jgi:hypothetical protein
MILESKENENKELQIITKEHESCQKQAESSRDQLKSAGLQYVASESLLEEDDDDYCVIIEESSLPEENIKDKEITKSFRSQRNPLKYEMKSMQVKRFFPE